MKVILSLLQKVKRFLIPHSTPCDCPEYKVLSQRDKNFNALIKFISTSPDMGIVRASKWWKQFNHTHRSCESLIWDNTRPFTSILNRILDHMPIDIHDNWLEDNNDLVQHLNYLDRDCRSNGYIFVTIDGVATRITYIDNPFNDSVLRDPLNLFKSNQYYTNRLPKRRA